jgi:hypothetical protein
VVIILVVVLNHSLGVTLAPHYPECRYMHPRGRQNLEHFLCYDVSPIRMVASILTPSRSGVAAVPFDGLSE